MVDEDTTALRDEDGAIFEAVASDDPAAVDRLLADRPELAWARDDDDLTPVIVARYGFSLAALDRLLAARGDDLDIFEAAAVGRGDLVRAALRADPSLAAARSVDGFTALHLASFFGAADAASVLVDAGADVDATSENAMRVRPLHSAAAGGHRSICRLLLERGADVNAVQRDAFTPLMAAAQSGDDELAEMLIAAGADLAARTDDGRSAADLARAAGHPALAERLTT
jgi:ankyrin repeat protein